MLVLSVRAFCVRLYQKMTPQKTTSMDQEFRCRVASIPSHGLGLPVDVYAPNRFDLLDALTHLRGLALEVDTKPAEHILAEFQRFGDRFGPALVNTRRPPDANDPTGDDRGRAREPSGEVKPAGDADRSHLLRQYDEYVQAALGRTSLSALELPSRHVHPEMLALYSQDYLPREILQWGGDLRYLFPDTCRRLEAHGISLAAFPDFWFRSPRPVRAPYDFFLLKLDRFIEFVQEVLSDARETAASKAAEMRSAYHLANEQVGT